MTVPPTPFLIHYTLINPWPASMILIAIAVILFRFGFVRGNQVTTHLSFVVVLVGVGLAVLAHFVETSPEALHRRTAHLVESAILGEKQTVSDLFSDDFTLFVGGQRADMDRDDVLSRIPALPGFITSNTITKLETGIHPDKKTGRSIFSQITSTAIGYPSPNQWRCEWRRDTDNQWRINQLHWEHWNGNATPSIAVLQELRP